MHKGKEDDLKPHYDFDPAQGVRGKYYTGSRLVVTVTLEEDVAKHFSSAKDVNAALRMFIAEGRAPAPRTE